MSIIVNPNGADFQTYVNIYENNAEIDNPLKYPFIRTYRVQTASGTISGEYTVSYINGILTNCTVEGTKLIAIFVNHGLPAGLLIAEHRWLLPADVPQGYMLISDSATNSPAYINQEILVLQGARGPHGIPPRISAVETWETWDDGINGYKDTGVSIYNNNKEQEQDASIDIIKEDIKGKAEKTGTIIYDQNGKLAMNAQSGIALFYTLQNKEAVAVKNGITYIKDSAGTEIVKINTDGSAPGLTLRGYAGSYGIWVGELGASWMYKNGMYAMTSAMAEFRDIRQGFTRYYSVTEGSELPFDCINGIASDAPQYTVYNKSGKKISEIDKNGIFTINNVNEKPGIIFNPTELNICDTLGNKCISLKNYGATPGLVMNGYNGSYGMWIGEKAASWMYKNGTYAFTTAKEDVADIVKGFTRYFPLENNPEIKFDRVNGIDGDKPQYEMFNKTGKVVLQIDKNNIFSVNHFTGIPAITFGINEFSVADFQGNKNITFKSTGYTPGLLLNGYKGSYGMWLGEKATTCMYYNGSYAWTISKEDILDIAKGFTRYYPIEHNPEIKFDRINGIDADKPQYEMFSSSGELILKIESTGELHLTPFSGKTIMFAGDSLMTGYPVSDYDMADTEKVKQYGYPYILGRNQNANIKLVALPNAVIRTHKQNGEDLTGNKSRSLCRKIAEAEQLYPTGGKERSEAIAFSYENSIMPYIQNIDLFCFGFGANDVEVDKISNTTWEPNSEFVKFDVNDQYNPAKFSIESRDRKSFIGATNYLIDEILKIKPDLKFCFIGHPTNDDAQSNSDQHHRLNSITKALAEYWGVPYIDMYNKLGWSHKNNNPKSPLKHYCPDNIHFATVDKKGLNYYVSALEKTLIQI